MNMLANDLSVVNFFTGFDKELAAILQLVDGVGESCSGFHCYHRTIGATGYFTLERLIFFKSMGHDGFALTGGENVSAQADDTARGDVELDIDALALCFHRCHFALTTGYHINHFAGKLFGNIDG